MRWPQLESPIQWSVRHRCDGPTRRARRADKHCRLSEVTSCWAKLADGSVGQQIDCPPSVMKGRDTQTQSGKCGTLYVTALGQCLAADAPKGKGK